ncbi:unnamed protein product [Periconia digitata]|uniref:Zn(2)-C6 fungal-type domain-containing protein n=1 Tax=Periconia digitata TaxID=1303443 RepID=A0A9W4U4E7_9PLEO|nr:unnamed protein product [Periconia digitata]
MTGVIKSSRCGTCRKRKVKCDEVKPVCGPCQKKNRVCEAPVSKYKFTEEHTTGASSAPPPIQTTFPALKLEKIAIVRSVPASDGGGFFQTMRLVRGRQNRPQDKINNRHSVIRKSPQMSSTESLQHTLCQTFQMYTGGYRISALASFVTEIPARLGHSEALDCAVACLVNCHASLCRNQAPVNDRMQEKLYAKSIVALQRALEDRVGGFTDETLAAVSIIGQVELFGGGCQGESKWVSHAGGAAKLLQIRGPEYCKTKFSKMLVSMQRMNSLAASIIRGEDCFFADSSWQQISYDELFTPEIHPVNVTFVTALLRLPSICKRIRLFHHNPELVDSGSIFLDIYSLRNSFAEVEEYVNEALINETSITVTAAQHDDSLTPFAYHFASRPLANLCVIYWGFSILIDTLLARFLPFQPLPTAVTLEELCDNCIQYRQRIVMSYEYAEHRWPLDVMFMVGPLIFSYHGATEEERDWIISKLWRLGELMPNSRQYWGRAGVERAIRIYLGEPI